MVAALGAGTGCGTVFLSTAAVVSEIAAVWAALPSGQVHASQATRMAARAPAPIIHPRVFWVELPGDDDAGALRVSGGA